MSSSSSADSEPSQLRLHEMYKENQQRLAAYIQRTRSLVASIETMSLKRSSKYRLLYPITSNSNGLEALYFTEKKNQTSTSMESKKMNSSPSTSTTNAKRSSLSSSSDVFASSSSSSFNVSKLEANEYSFPKASSSSSSSLSSSTDSLPLAHSHLPPFKVLILDLPHNTTLPMLPKQTLSNLLLRKLKDIVTHLNHLESRILDKTCRILVTGDLNAGKSSMINALLRKPILPVDQQPLTNCFTEVLSNHHHHHHLEQVHEYADLTSKSYKVHGLESLPHLVNEGHPHGLLRVFCATPHTTTSVLMGNDGVDVRLIDAPGLNRDVINTMALFSQQKEIDVIVFVVSAENHFTLSSREFLTNAGQEKAYIFVVVNKFDAIQNKDKCRQLILEQIQQLSPHTYAQKDQLVHFISAAQAMAWFEDQTQNNDTSLTYDPKGMSDSLKRNVHFSHLTHEQVKNSNPIERKDTPVTSTVSTPPLPPFVTSFLNAEHHLKAFTLEKRSVAKLFPAKRFLALLLTDLHHLLDYNQHHVFQQREEVEHWLQRFTPSETILLDQLAQATQAMQQAVQTMCLQMDGMVQARFTKLPERLLFVSQQVPCHGLFYLSTYVRDLKNVLISTVAQEVDQCQSQVQSALLGVQQSFTQIHQAWFQVFQQQWQWIHPGSDTSATDVFSSPMFLTHTLGLGGSAPSTHTLPTSSTATSSMSNANGLPTFTFPSTPLSALYPIQWTWSFTVFWRHLRQYPWSMTTFFPPPFSTPNASSSLISRTFFSLSWTPWLTSLTSLLTSSWMLARHVPLFQLLPPSHASSTSPLSLATSSSSSTSYSSFLLSMTPSFLLRPRVLWIAGGLFMVTSMGWCGYRCWVHLSMHVPGCMTHALMDQLTSTEYPRLLQHHVVTTAKMLVSQSIGESVQQMEKQLSLFKEKKLGVMARVDELTTILHFIEEVQGRVELLEEQVQGVMVDV
ncbi:mitofusin [Coelomomyces lativittatus]|nr:mitofusin [Coelomomyces lativittatus]KAJ1510194.1 mitofusin [Coelomomyces lativittatus]KAJ1511490.1 mitofusin [Coelomomyces lativittatus]